MEFYVYSRSRLGLQSSNPTVSLSKYPAKAIEGSRLNWNIYLDLFDSHEQ